VEQHGVEPGMMTSLEERGPTKERKAPRCWKLARGAILVMEAPPSKVGRSVVLRRGVEGGVGEPRTWEKGSRQTSSLVWSHSTRQAGGTPLIR